VAVLHIAGGKDTFNRGAGIGGFNVTLCIQIKIFSKQ
jgi:hypothetical protein